MRSRFGARLEEAGVQAGFERFLSESKNMLPHRKPKWIAPALLAVTASFICLGSLAAQDFSGGAKVLVMTGRVSYLRDSNEVALNVGMVVPPKQVIFTGPDGYAKFELPDGSTFEVFHDSKAVFRPSGGWGDLLDLWIGHVKVFINHRNGPNYNRITTQTAVISVRGTTFDVDAEDEDTTFISVDEGVVGVRHARLPGNEVQLQAGQSLRVYKDQPLARNVDKGATGRAALRLAAQAVYDWLAHRDGLAGASGASSGSGTGTPGQQGDAKGGPAPPPPPPTPTPNPPPPPPPHP